MMAEPTSSASDNHALRRLSMGHLPSSSSSPFPSPSSSFLPPPVPGAHEFANKSMWTLRKRRNGSKETSPVAPSPTQTQDALAPRPEAPPISTSAAMLVVPLSPATSSQASTPATPTQHSTTAAAQATKTTINGAKHLSAPAAASAAPAVPAIDISNPALVAPDSVPTSAAKSVQNPIEPPAVLNGPTTPNGLVVPADSSPTTPTVPTGGTPIKSPPPSSFRASRDMDPSSFIPPSSARSSRIVDIDIASSRPAPPSPAPSRRQSLRRSQSHRHSTRSMSTGLSASVTRTGKAPKVRDFGFPAADPRHVGAGAQEVESRRSSGWGSAFRWSGGGGGSKFPWLFGGGSNAATHSPSPTPPPAPGPDDFARNFVSGGPDESGGSDSSDFDGEPEADEDGELQPGWYRALYAFEPEGTAEMALAEDALVRVLGRGGGVGWAVAVRGSVEPGAGVRYGAGAEGERRCALVPESYLEWVRAFEDGEEDGATGEGGGGGGTPKIGGALELGERT